MYNIRFAETLHSSTSINVLRNYSNRVSNVFINNVNILSEKATNDLLGFPNVTSQVVFDSILALCMRAFGTLWE